MPRRDVHLRASSLVGIGAAIVTAPPVVGGQAGAYFAGTFVGARYGGCLPDLLEPATNPRHRAFFHSLATLSEVARLNVFPPLALIEARKALIDRAASLRTQRESLPLDNPNRSSLWLEDMACCFVAGLSVGVLVGYLTHLLQDANTSPLPLI